MAEVDLGGGVVVETAERIQVRRATAEASLAAAAEPERSALAAGLAEAGFTVAAQADLRARPHDGPGLGIAPGGEPPQIKVDLKPGEGAVVLLEGEGGVFGWGLPDPPRGAALSLDGARTVTFTLAAARPAEAAGPGFDLGRLFGRRGPLFNWLVDRLIQPVRIYVLKFAAEKIIEVAVRKIEGSTPTGLISMAGGAATWVPGQPIAALDQGRPARLLLMVHGTFSTTKGSFQDLETEKGAATFLARARSQFDAILAFDHKTLAETPEENARQFMDALIRLGVPQGSSIDAVAFSRGGLVCRVLTESLMAAERPDLKLGKTVFVGCTNAGTNLAEPEHWEVMVEGYTNMLLAAARGIAFVTGAAAVSPMVTIGIKLLGAFVQSFAEVAVTDRKVPGLAAMEPDGATVKALNGAAGGLERLGVYQAVTSDFVPRFEPSKGITKELAQALLDKLTNDLFGGPNDLVVDTTSMTTFGTRQPKLAATDALPAGEVVYHTVYFRTDAVVKQLSGWLV